METRSIPWLLLFTYPSPPIFFTKDMSEFEPAETQLSSSAAAGTTRTPVSKELQKAVLVVVG